jgi:hypothetical protein
LNFKKNKNYLLSRYGHYRWGEVTLDPGGLISPLLQLWDEETQELYWVDSSDELSLWTDKENLEYAFSTLESGLEVGWF